MGLIIGHRGETLDSLQYLVSLVINKNNDGKYKKVILDTENYRLKREETLKRLATKIAYKVRKTNRAVKLEPMNPYERRIIHAALQNDSYVVTYSEGEEPYRKVVVDLKKKA
jgi:spoIIIJ-associated protein